MFLRLWLRQSLGVFEGLRFRSKCATNATSLLRKIEQPWIIFTTVALHRLFTNMSIYSFDKT